MDIDKEEGEGPVAGKLGVWTHRLLLVVLGFFVLFWSPNDDDEILTSEPSTSTEVVDWSLTRSEPTRSKIMSCPCRACRVGDTTATKSGRQSMTTRYTVMMSADRCE